MTVDDSQRYRNGNQVVYLVDEQDNPSTDFFVLPVLNAGELNVIRCGFSDVPSAENLENALVVFVRYVPSTWITLISKFRSKLRGLVYFMDDDVLDFRASTSMPLRYRFKLARLAARHKNWLRKMDAELWVSTSYLKQKYSTWKPKLILPRPLGELKDMCRVFYHGSASHKEEIDWLRPVIADVLHKDEHICFEVIGGRDVYRLYKGLSRVTVVHPMKWEAYQSFIAIPGRHIGLAPLLDVKFNYARSYTKFFDITRCGAVGIYSSDSLCADVIDQGIDGVVVSQEQDLWVESILKLADDELLRNKMLGKAEQKLIQLDNKAYQGYLDLIK